MSPHKILVGRQSQSQRLFSQLPCKDKPIGVKRKKAMGFVFTMSKILLIYSVMIEQPFVWIHSIWVWSNNNYIGLATPPSPPTSPTWYCDKGRNRIMRSRYIQDTRQLYLWSIGTIYMIAFVSLYVQIPGKMVM